MSTSPAKKRHVIGLVVVCKTKEERDELHRGAELEAAVRGVPYISTSEWLKMLARKRLDDLSMASGKE